MLAYEFTAGPALALVERPAPAAQPGGVVLDVVAAGICGTDLKILRGEHRLYPEGTVRIPGHELVGRVRENASGRPGLEPGALVAVAPNIACGRCAPCRAGRGNLCADYEAVGLTFDGAFAERIAIPARAVEQGNLLPVPDGVDPAVAALVEPIAAVLRGLRAIGLRAEDRLLVQGAGPIGLIAVLLSRQLGVGRVIVSQTSAPRRELALRLGADAAIDPRAEDLVGRVREETDGLGADAVLVSTPAPSAFAASLEAAAVGGRINFFAGLPSGAGVIPLDANLVHYRELTVTGSTANTTADCADALALLLAEPERYAPIVTHRLPLARLDEAVEELRAGRALKAVVLP